MRLLSLNIKNNLIEELEQEELYICDVAEDFSDALYHAEVRFYNIIVIKESSLKKCLRFLRVVDFKKCAVVIVTDNLDKSFEIEVLNKGAITVIKEPASSELIKARLEAIHRENFASMVYYKDRFGIDREKKAVLDHNNKEINIKGKSFDVLFYLLKNRHRSAISKDEIIDALWDEPELISNNIVEVNINQIRNELKKRFQANLVDTVRNRGYKITN